MSQDINKVECTEQITKDCYCYVCVNGTFRRAKISDLLALVDADEVTPETIEAALEYVPADQKDIEALEEELKKKQPSGDYALRSELPMVPVQSVNGQTGAVSLGATDVGADASGTAGRAVSEHNTEESAHNDIRLLIEGLTTRLNALANSDDLTLDQMAEVVAYIKSNRSLIESVTTNKVNVSDIINDLTTSVSNKPLSAAQGVKLKNLITELQSAVDLKAPKNHASTATTYGAATDSNYGHVKLYDTYDSQLDKDDGVAATPAAVYKAYSRGNDAYTKATNAYNLAGGKADPPEKETWTFILEDGSTVTKAVHVG